METFSLNIVCDTDIDYDRREFQGCNWGLVVMQGVLWVALVKA